MAIFAKFVHWLPNILHTWPHDSFQVIWLSMILAYFKVIGLFHIKFLKNGVRYGRLLIGNRTLAFDWCHFWWPWSTFEGHFSLGCHFHVHFSNPWHPAIAEHLVSIVTLGLALAGSPKWTIAESYNDNCKKITLKQVNEQCDCRRFTKLKFC